MILCSLQLLKMDYSVLVNIVSQSIEYKKFDFKFKNNIILL